MSKPKISKSVLPFRFVVALVAALLLTGCGLFKPSKKISVPQPLTPLVEADMERMFGEINRVAAVRSINGKVDIQFLDNSYAECGIAEKYRTADGKLVVQRPGKVYLIVQFPVIGTKVAEMSSTGERFWAAVYQGDEKYRALRYGDEQRAVRKAQRRRQGHLPRLQRGRSTARTGDAARDRERALNLYARST